MKFKINNLSVLFSIESSLGSSIDIQKNKETDKQKIDNLPKNVQDFLGLKGDKNTEVKISKNKKGETVYNVLYEDYRLSRNIKEKDILVLSGRLSKQRGVLNYMNLTLFDFLLKIPPNGNIEMQGIAGRIKDNISDILKIKKGLDKIPDGYLKNKLNNKDFLKNLMLTSLYYLNYQYGNVNDIISLVKIYDEKLLKGKTNEEKENIISGIFADLSDGCKNLKFYKNDKFKNILGNLKFGKEKIQDPNVVGKYDRYLNLTSFDSNQLNLSETINDKIDITDLEEYNDLGLEKKLKQGEKISPNELIVINLVLSGKKELLKENFNENQLKNIAEKFGFNDIESFKKDIYKEQLKKITIGRHSLNKKINNIQFNNIYTKIPLNKATDLYYNLLTIKNEFSKDNINVGSRKLKNDMNNEIKNTYKNFKQNVLEASFSLDNTDKKVFLNVINGELEKSGFEKITIKESDEQYKKKIDNLFFIMNKIESTKIDFDKLLGKFSDNIECIDENKAKDVLSKMFSKGNIPKLREELSKSSLSPMEFILQRLDEKQFFDNFKIKDKKQKLSNNDKYDIVHMMMGNFLEQIKGTQALKIENSVEDNKQLNTLIEDLGHNIFKDGKEGSGKIKKDLALANLKYDIGKVLVDNNKKVLTKDFLVKHKDEILNLIKKQFGVNLKEQGNLNKYYDNVKTLLGQLTEKIPSGGIKIDLDLKGLEQTRKLIESIKKDNKKYEELGYKGYIEYQEKLENEKKMLEHVGSQVDENIPLERSLFKGESGQGVQTKMKNEGGIYTLQMHIPGEKNVIEVKSLKLEEANKIIMSKYIKNRFGFNLDLKGNSDQLNKVISSQTDITNDGITSEDLKDTSVFLQNYIYETFYKDGNDKSKKFLKDNDLNIYDLYNKPEDFSKRFVQGMKKQVNMGGFQADFDKFNLDLNGLGENFFDKNLIKTHKEEVDDNGRDFYKNEGNGVFFSLTNRVKKMFG